MLVLDHRTVIPDYYGVTTSFNKAVLKPGVTVLASEEGAPWVKYIHGDYGKGSWTFLGEYSHVDCDFGSGSDNANINAYSIEGGYWLTGENQPYDKDRGTFGRVFLALSTSGSIPGMPRRAGRRRLQGRSTPASTAAIRARPRVRRARPASSGRGQRAG